MLALALSALSICLRIFHVIGGLILNFDNHRGSFFFLGASLGAFDGGDTEWCWFSIILLGEKIIKVVLVWELPELMRIELVIIFLLGIRVIFGALFVGLFGGFRDVLVRL